MGVRSEGVVGVDWLLVVVGLVWLVLIGCCGLVVNVVVWLMLWFGWLMLIGCCGYLVGGDVVV